MSRTRAGGEVYPGKKRPGGICVIATRKRRRARVAREACVACGCGGKVCPLGAIQVERGLFARVDPETCVGCGKCARECPASVIEMEEVPG